MSKLIQQSKELLDALLNTSNEIFAAAEAANWAIFLQLTNRRTTMMADFKSLHAEFNAEYAGKMRDDQKKLLNAEINLKIKNISKVDSKILDIVSREKKSLSQKVNLANQGKTFLRNYQKRINSQSTVFKTM